jgi:3',5'-cyclic AMP phosphodiesterase CpdA
VVTGDLVDNAQANELDLAVAVLSGGRADPDSGATGYDGVQAPGNPDPYYYRPDHDAPRHPGLADTAQRPFRAAGLRAPWYPAVGNHDALVQGEVPTTPAIEQVAVGGDLGHRARPAAATPDRRERGARGRRGAAERRPAGAQRARAGRSRSPAARRRRGVKRLREAGAAGTGTVGGRLDYAVDIGRHLRAIVLDTVRREGGSRGIVVPAQVTWLRRELTRAAGRHVVVFSHNPLDASDGGDAALSAMAGSGNVVAAVAGHRHRNAIEPYRPAASG